MSGLLHGSREQLQSRRLLGLAALLSVVLLVSSGRVWAQEAEPDEGGMNESALQKKGKAPEQKKGEILPPPTGIAFTTRLDRTAVWVGDRFHYIISVDYTPEYDFRQVAENTTRETVNMEPFQVMDLTKQFSDLKGGNSRLVVDITLANFGTGQTSIQIPQTTLYYFRKDKKAATAENQAAESLSIPGPAIGIRSTLPPQPSDIRDNMTVMPWDRSRQVLPIAAWVCTLVLVIGVSWEGWLMVQRRKSRKGPDRRKAMEAVRSRWASSVPSDFSDSKAMSAFYSSSYQNVKEFVGYYLETPALGLTAEEMHEEMKRLGADSELTRKVSKVLETCETVSYGRPGTDGAETARSVAQEVREILNSKG